MKEPITAWQREMDDAYSRDWEGRRDPMGMLDFALSLKIPDKTDARGRNIPNDPTGHPMQWIIIEMVADDPRASDITLISDTQAGKTWMMQEYLLWLTIELGQMVIFGLPNKAMKDAVWQEKLRPAIIGSGNGIYMPTSGPGSRDGSAPTSLKLRYVDGVGGGGFNFMSANGRKQAGQASISSPTAAMDELDDWDAAAIARLERRADSFASDGLARFWRSTTVKDDYASNGLNYFHQGTGERIGYLHRCGAYTRFLWEHTDLDAGHILCEHCKEPIDNDERLSLMAPKFLARIAADDTAHRLSLMCTALDCPWKSLAWLRDLHADAARLLQRGDHSQMRQFYRDQRVEQYRDSGAKTNPTTSALAQSAARSDYYRGERPAWASWSVVSVDVQADRVYVMVLSFDADRYAIVEWGERYYLRKDERDLGQDITDPKRREVLDSVYSDYMVSGVLGQDGSEKQVCDAMIVDVGHEGKCVSQWVKKHARAYCVRGQDSDRKTAPSGAVVKTYADGMLAKRKLTKRPAGYPAHWWWMSTADIRGRTHAALQMDGASVGAILLPVGTAADDRLMMHLTAWELQTDPDTGAEKWVKRRTRDDYDDTLCYAWAFADHVKTYGGTASSDAVETSPGGSLHAPVASEFGSVL